MPKNFSKAGGKKFGGKKFGGASQGPRRGHEYRDSGMRPQLFRATCTGCHAACEVPFQPSGDRPVYCRNCFRKDEESGPRTHARSDARPSAFGEKKLFQVDCDACGQSCEVPFKPSGNREVLCRSCFGKDGSSDRGNGGEVMAEIKAMNIKLDTILRTLAAMK